MFKENFLNETDNPTYGGHITNYSDVSTEKTCPLLKKACVKNECMMFVGVQLSPHTGAEEFNYNTCSLAMRGNLDREFICYPKKNTPRPELEKDGIDADTAMQLNSQLPPAFQDIDAKPFQPGDSLNPEYYVKDSAQWQVLTHGLSLIKQALMNYLMDASDMHELIKLTNFESVFSFWEEKIKPHPVSKIESDVIFYRKLKDFLNSATTSDEYEGDEALLPLLQKVREWYTGYLKCKGTERPIIDAMDDKIGYKHKKKKGFINNLKEFLKTAVETDKSDVGYLMPTARRVHEWFISYLKEHFTAVYDHYNTTGEAPELEFDSKNTPYFSPRKSKNTNSPHFTPGKKI